MPKHYVFLPLLVLFFSWNSWSQRDKPAPPVFMGSAEPIHVAPLSTKDLLPPYGEFKVVNPRNRGSNKVVPGKGFPKGVDAVWQKQPGKIQGKSPELSFDAATSGSTPTDPTGAVGPNHYLNAWNSAFAIYDKQGNLVSPPAALKSLGGTFANDSLGDPIIIYDEFADRFLITQLDSDPNGFLVAVSKGPDPVNDGWYTYRFNTNTFPDYPKFFVWSDGYYITTNKDQFAPGSNEVVYVLERDKMLAGEEAQHLGFPLPGAETNSFYSPAGFFAVGDVPPPKGDSPIVYFQDDSWAGVNEDHLKIWLINVDWENPENSTVELSQELGRSAGVTPFISTFDGGSFTNLAQPGDNYDVDALQGAIMYMTPYRRFATHNSVVFNFVVDIDASAAEHAGIRWYELRQDSGGGPWSVYQEGTYAPDNSDRWCGSIGIDEFGNIGMGFTVLNDNPENPIFPSLRYTGRYATDPPGVMTIREVPIIEGPSPDPHSRYGDYAHLTIDPVDGKSFWYIGEYFVEGERRNRVGVFNLEPEFNTDVGVVNIISPVSSTLGNAEEVSITIRNFGQDTQTSIPITLAVNGEEVATEVYTGSLPRVREDTFTFTTTVDLSEVGEIYEITATTELPGDENSQNDSFSVSVENLQPIDVGVTSIDAPKTDLLLTSTEPVTVTIQNFGGEPQSDIPIAYSIDGGELVTEVYPGPLGVGEQVSFTFDTTVDIAEPGTYEIFATTVMEGDSDTTNDSTFEVIANLSCIPEGSDCGSFGDGIADFYLEEIVNENIPCAGGYNDYIGFYAELDRVQGTYTVTISSRYASGSDEKFSMWIDFNDNGTFEASEIVISEEIIPSSNKNHSYDFTIPADAPLGEHVLRVRAGDTSFDGELNDPCSVMAYGTTHDYSVLIVDSSLTIEDLDLAEAEMVVTNRGGDVFDVRMQTSYEETLRITVHDLLGQKLVENMVEKTDKIYYYELDMSYAATGVYLVRLGTRKVGKVTRILVK